MESGHWVLMRYNPELAREGKNPLVLDSKEPTLPLKDYVYNETRYKMLTKMHPEVAAQLLAEEEKDLRARWRYYRHLADMPWEN